MNDDDPVYAELTHVHGWFNVKTLHEHRLEFVLRAAEERNEQPYRYYVDQLVSALGEEFKGDPSRGIVEEQYMGDISLCLLADDVEDLMEGLGMCDAVIERWTKRFNVDKMKDDK